MRRIGKGDIVIYEAPTKNSNTSSSAHYAQDDKDFAFGVVDHQITNTIRT